MKRKRPTRRRSFRRKPRMVKRRYAENWALHKYEEDVIVRVLCEVGPSNSWKLDQQFPGRFDRILLEKRFKALLQQCRIIRSGVTFRKTQRSGRLVHAAVYTVVYGPHHAPRYAEVVELNLDRERSARAVSPRNSKGEVVRYG